MGERKAKIGVWAVLRGGFATHGSREWKWVGNGKKAFTFAVTMTACGRSEVRPKDQRAQDDAHSVVALAGHLDWVSPIAGKRSSGRDCAWLESVHVTCHGDGSEAAAWEGGGGRVRV